MLSQMEYVRVSSKYSFLQYVHICDDPYCGYFRHFVLGYFCHFYYVAFAFCFAESVSYLIASWLLMLLHNV